MWQTDEGKKEQKKFWIFLAAVITVAGCCLMLFMPNGDDAPRETTCQHEWQNDNTAVICAKCGDVITTSSDTKISSSPAPENNTTEAAEESKPKQSVAENVPQQEEITPKYPIAVDGGAKHFAILYSDGTVSTIGDDTYAQRSTSGWKDITQISTFSNHTLGLKKMAQ